MDRIAKAPTSRGGYGSIPERAELDHFTCHFRSCVNPEHLKPATRKKNMENLSGAYSTSKSGVRGVSWNKANQKWVGTVRHNGVKHHAGYHESIEDATAAVIAKRNELFTNNQLDRSAA